MRAGSVSVVLCSLLSRPLPTLSQPSALFSSPSTMSHLATSHFSSGLSLDIECSFLHPSKAKVAIPFDPTVPPHSFATPTLHFFFFFLFSFFEIGSHSVTQAGVHSLQA
uniref:Secreted protein n=1 Tax=Pan troglodytes TaxID=9598 RepID=A0A2I3TUP2_PANTR